MPGPFDDFLINPATGETLRLPSGLSPQMGLQRPGPPPVMSAVPSPSADPYWNPNSQDHGRPGMPEMPDSSEAPLPAFMPAAPGSEAARGYAEYDSAGNRASPLSLPMGASVGPTSGIARIAQSAAPIGTVGQIGKDPAIAAALEAARRQGNTPLDPAYAPPPTPLANTPATFAGAQDTTLRGFDKERAAQGAIAAAQAAGAKSEADAYAESIARQDALAAQRERERQEEAKTAQRIADEGHRATDEWAAYKVDPGRLWRNTSTAGKIGAGISMIFSVLGDALQRKSGPNMALEIIENAIKDDVAQQMSDRENLKQVATVKRSSLDDYLKRTGRAEDAYSLKMAELLKRQAQVVKQRAALASAPEIKARGEEAAAKLEQMAGNHIGSMADGAAKRDMQRRDLEAQIRHQRATEWLTRRGQDIDAQQRQLDRDERAKDRAAQLAAAQAEFQGKSAAEQQKMVRELGIDRPGSNGTALVDERGLPVLAGRTADEAKKIRAGTKSTEVALSAIDRLREKAAGLSPSMFPDKQAAAFNTELGLLELQIKDLTNMGAYDAGSASKLASIVGGDPTKVSASSLARSFGIGVEPGEIVQARLDALGDFLERSALTNLGNPVMPAKRDAQGNVLLDENGLPRRESVFNRPDKPTRADKAFKQVMKPGATTEERGADATSGFEKGILAISNPFNAGDVIARREEANAGPSSTKYLGFTPDRDKAMDEIVAAVNRGDERATASMLEMVRNPRTSNAALGVIKDYTPQLYRRALNELPDEQRKSREQIDQVTNRQILPWQQALDTARNYGGR